MWVGDPAQIRAKQVRKQTNDRRDAEHLLKLMLENHFFQLWVPTAEERDVRQLVLHRHWLVQIRTRVMNQLQGHALNSCLVFVSFFRPISLEQRRTKRIACCG